MGKCLVGFTDIKNGVHITLSMKPGKGGSITPAQLCALEAVTELVKANKVDRKKSYVKIGKKKYKVDAKSQS